MARTELQLFLKGLEIRVRSDNALDLTWVEEFFAPGFSPARANKEQEVIRTIELSSNAASFKSAMDVLAVTRARSAAFVLDAGTQELPSILGSTGFVQAHDALFGTIYEMANEKAVIRDMWTPDTEGRRARASFMQIINAYAMDYARRTGAVVMHAAGVVHKGRAWLIAGAKNSGKTSLLSALLSAFPRLELLSNDRILVWPGGKPLLARGLSCLVSIRGGSLDVVPALRDKLAHVPRNYTGELWPTEPLRDPYRLTPMQFRQMFGAPAVAEAPLGCILLPSITEGVTGLRVRRLGQAEAHERLPTALYGYHDLEARTELFSLPESGAFPEAAQSLATLYGIAAETPIYEVMLGLDAYRRSALEDLLGVTLAS